LSQAPHRKHRKQSFTAFFVARPSYQQSTAQVKPYQRDQGGGDGPPSSPPGQRLPLIKPSFRRAVPPKPPNRRAPPFWAGVVPDCRLSSREGGRGEEDGTTAPSRARRARTRGGVAVKTPLLGAVMQRPPDCVWGGRAPGKVSPLAAWPPPIQRTATVTISDGRESRPRVARAGIPTRPGSFTTPPSHAPPRYFSPLPPGHPYLYHYRLRLRDSYPKSTLQYRPSTLPARYQHSASTLPAFCQRAGMGSRANRPPRKRHSRQQPRPVPERLPECHEPALSLGLAVVGDVEFQSTTRAFSPAGSSLWERPQRIPI